LQTQNILVRQFIFRFTINRHMLTVFAKEYLLDLSTFGNFYGQKWSKLRVFFSLNFSHFWPYKFPKVDRSSKYSLAKTVNICLPPWQESSKKPGKHDHWSIWSISHCFSICLMYNLIKKKEFGSIKYNIFEKDCTR
jgi:hypothetical protein